MNPSTEQQLREKIGWWLSTLQIKTIQNHPPIRVTDADEAILNNAIEGVFSLLTQERKAWGEHVLDKFRFNNEEHLLCETCWGRAGSRFGGAAMTSWNCKRCGGHQTSGSTAHGTLCDGCSLKSGKCKWCNYNDNILNQQRNQEEGK